MHGRCSAGGFDPGGVGQFGWALGTTEDLALPSIVASGRAPSAEVAVATALSIAGDPDGVAAAGIDAPLFWTPAGVRNVDNLVRRAMHARGAKTPSRTVQQLNSLRGAVLVQGLVAAMLLRERVHGLPITETHPKALLWLLGIASPARGHADVPLADVWESRGDSNGHDVSFDLDF